MCWYMFFGIFVDVTEQDWRLCGVFGKKMQESR